MESQPLMDEDQQEEFRQELYRAFASLDMNQETSDEEDYLDEEQSRYEPTNDAMFFDDDADDINDSDAYDWPDRSVLDTFTGLPDAETSPLSINGAEPSETGVDDQDEEQDHMSEVSMNANGQEVTITGQESTDKEKKKKKKRKNKKKNKNYPAVEDDLFEEQVQDLAIFERLYDVSTPADERYRLAMENFRKERTFTIIPQQILSTFFSYGYMDPNQDLTATNAMTEEGYEIEMQVDFVYVVASFLSSFMFKMRGWYESTYFLIAPKVVASFLKYLLCKRVLPEYETELTEALAIAKKSKIESPQCYAFNKTMPDDISLTLSVLYLPHSYVVTDLPSTGDAVLASLGVISNQETPLRLTRFLTGVVLRTEKKPTEGVQETDVVALATVICSTLESLTSTISGAVKEDKTEMKSEGVKPKEEEWALTMSAEAAALLSPGMVIEGTFYSLSSGITFARPLHAYPSFFIEAGYED
ncbi:hypothetical protein BGZ83_000725 [Gryganskiella cystojenkinii]|nr:hypothetical protein BGZ83_000725 [Gryganskiella cystojenkinii]